MKKQAISGKMSIGEIVEKYPEVAEELVVKYGFHCLGCFGASMETLEEGAMVHGMEKDEIKKMIEKLNVVANKKK